MRRRERRGEKEGGMEGKREGKREGTWECRNSNWFRFHAALTLAHCTVIIM